MRMRARTDSRYAFSAIVITRRSMDAANVSTTLSISFDESLFVEQPYQRKSPAERAEFGVRGPSPRDEQEGQLPCPAIDASRKHSEPPFRRGFAWVFAAHAGPLHEPN